MYCSNCGNKINDIETYCSNCGNKVTRIENNIHYATEEVFEEVAESREINQGILPKIKKIYQKFKVLCSTILALGATTLSILILTGQLDDIWDNIVSGRRDPINIVKDYQLTNDLTGVESETFGDFAKEYDADYDKTKLETGKYKVATSMHIDFANCDAKITFIVSNNPDSEEVTLNSLAFDNLDTGESLYLSDEDQCKSELFDLMQGNY